MIVFLDTNIVIYFIENPPVYGRRATAYVTGLVAQGHSFSVTNLVRMECRTLPLRLKDAAVLADYDAFFALPNVKVLDISAALCDRATELRAVHHFKPMDALHLAAAGEKKIGKNRTTAFGAGKCPGYYRHYKDGTISLL